MNPQIPNNQNLKLDTNSKICESTSNLIKEIIVTENSHCETKINKNQ